MSSGRTRLPMPERSWRCSTLFHQRSPWFLIMAGSSRKTRGAFAALRRSSSECSWRPPRGRRTPSRGRWWPRRRGGWVVVRSSAGSSPPSRAAPAAVPERVRRALMAVRIFSVTGVSVRGSRSALSRVEAERWVSGSKRRMDSISSPKKSMRTGRSDSGL